MVKRRSRFEVRKTCWRTGESSQSRSLPRDGVDPALDQDQLAEQGAGDQADVGEVEDQADRRAVVGQADGDLFGDLADGALVEELMVVESDHLDAVDVADLDPGGSGHDSKPWKSMRELDRQNADRRDSLGFGFGFSPSQPARAGQAAWRRARPGSGRGSRDRSLPSAEAAAGPWAIRLERRGAIGDELEERLELAGPEDLA